MGWFNLVHSVLVHADFIKVCLAVGLQGMGAVAGHLGWHHVTMSKMGRSHRRLARFSFDTF
jgi:hypothetical protein